MLYLYNDGRNPHVCYRPRCRRPGFSYVVGPAYRMYVIQDIPDRPNVKYNPVSCEDMTRSPALVCGASRRCYSLEERNKRIRGVSKGLDEYVKREQKVNKSCCDVRVVGSVRAFVVAGKRKPLVIPNQAVVGAAVITSCRQLLSDVPIASTCANVTPVCRVVYNVTCLSFPAYLFLPSTTARARQQGCRAVRYIVRYHGIYAWFGAPRSALLPTTDHSIEANDLTSHAPTTIGQLHNASLVVTSSA